MSRGIRRVFRGVTRAVRGLGSMVGLSESEAQKKARRQREQEIADEQARIKKAEDDRRKLEEFNRQTAQQQAQAQQTQTQPQVGERQYDFASALKSMEDDEEDDLKKLLTIKR